MHRSRGVLFVLALGFGFSPGPSGAGAPSARPRVEWVGSMHEVMGEGDVRPRLDLMTLARRPQLYALGALAGLEGEILVSAGQPSIATIVSGQVAVEHGFGHQATLLVWAEVGRWRKERISAPVADLAALEALIEKEARARGFDPAVPFPFRVTGRATSGEIHVVNARGAAPAGGHDAHVRIQVRFPLEREKVELLGFFSTAHQGVLTHHGSNVHLHHARGHVDALQLERGATLFLPR